PPTSLLFPYTTLFRSRLAFNAQPDHPGFPMGLPRQTVPLSPEQVAELSRNLSDLRHNINNHLALMVAALELIRRKPAMVERMLKDRKSTRLNSSHEWI